MLFGNSLRSLDNDPYGCLGLGSPKILTAMLISQRGWHYRAGGLTLCPRGHCGVVEASRDRRNRLGLIFRKSPQASFQRLDQRGSLSQRLDGAGGREGEGGRRHSGGPQALELLGSEGERCPEEEGQS